jgi:hypothetical protein
MAATDLIAVRPAHDSLPSDGHDEEEEGTNSKTISSLSSSRRGSSSRLTARRSLDLWLIETTHDTVTAYLSLFPCKEATSDEIMEGSMSIRL